LKKTLKKPATKQSAEKVEKQKIKLLQYLDFKPKDRKLTSELGSSVTTSNKSKKQKNADKTVFTEEDFQKFEREYFVTD